MKSHRLLYSVVTTESWVPPTGEHFEELRAEHIVFCFTVDSGEKWFLIVQKQKFNHSTWRTLDILIDINYHKAE